MSKAIEGAAMLGGAVLDGAAMFLMASTGVGIAALPFMATLMGTLVAGGIAMEAGAIAGALTANRGMDITTRQAAAARQIIYGMQRVGGVMVYQNTTGSSKNQYNMVIVLAGHECWAFSELYLDGRKVIWQGANPAHPSSTYLPGPGGIYFGGEAAGGLYEGPDGQQYSFNALVYAVGYYGQQTAAGGADPSLQANDPAWAETASGVPYLGGCSWFYLKCEYDPGTFPQRPEVRMTVMGKPVYDPRTGVTAYSANAALICADWITDSEYGLGMQVNQAQLIAAANICDEQVPLANQPNQPGGITSGLTEARYECHYHFDTSTAPTDALATMLKSMGGRISLIGGEIYLWPAAWLGTSAAFDESALTSSVSWDPTAEYKSAVNQVRGTYMAPNYPYNIAGNLYDANGFAPDGTLLNTWQFGFTAASFPPYAQDPLHGYASNQWLNEDSGVTAAWAAGTTFALGQVVSYVTEVLIGSSSTTVPYYQVYRSLVPNNLNNTPSPTSTAWQLAPVNLRMDANYNMVLSIAQAQRLAKIDLMRRRFWGRGRLEMGLSAFALQECDVMSFTFPPHNWVGKALEIRGCTLAVKVQDGAPGELGSPAEVRVAFDVGETDASIYTWSVTEELSIYDVPLSQMGMSSVVAPPTVVTAVSTPSTALIGADGIATARIEVLWDTPQDPFVTRIMLQYMVVGAPVWSDGGTVSAELNSAFIGPITAGLSYLVQIRSERPNGATSVWVGPVAVNASPLTSLLGVASLPINVVDGATGTNINLVPDSNIQFGLGAYWSYPGADWTLVEGAATGNPTPETPVPGCMALQVSAAASGSFQSTQSYTFQLVVGQTYTLSGFIDAYYVTAGNPMWAVFDTTISTKYAYALQNPGATGRVSSTFVFSPAGVAAGTSISVRVIFDVDGCTITAGEYILGSAPMVELGANMTAYLAGVAHTNATAGLIHRAMSSQVQGSVDTSGNVLNLGGISHSLITPISGLMPYEAGATKVLGLSANQTTTASYSSNSISSSVIESSSSYQNFTTSATIATIASMPVGGGYVLLTVSGAIASTNANAFGWGITFYRNGVALTPGFAYQVFATPGDSKYKPFSFSIIDSAPGAGPNTYTVVANVNSTGTASVIPANLIAINFKA